MLYSQPDCDQCAYVPVRRRDFILSWSITHVESHLMRSKTGGARSPKGTHGERGKRGERGERGQRGEQGQRGERGLRGERGPAGPPPTRAEILAVVEAQFSDIRTQLEIQLTRFGQIQAQLDHIQKLFVQLTKDKD